MQRLSLDPGTITRPLIIFGGLYGDLEAITALIAEGQINGAFRAIT